MMSPLKDLTITKKTNFVILLLIYSFAFIYSPYWLVFSPFPVLKYVALFGFFGIGIVWAYMSSGVISLAKIPKIIPTIILAGILFILNYRALQADISWRGDESFHINLVLNLFKYVFRDYSYFIWLLLLSGAAFVYSLRQRLPKWLSFTAIILIPLTALILFPSSALKSHKEILVLSDILRYPYLSKWLNLLFILPNPYQVELYRLVPFLSAVLTSGYLFNRYYVVTKNTFLSLCFSLLTVTTPLLTYYSSILYLEMPVILLMFISVFNLKEFITADSSEIKSKTVWFCLIIMSFLKETVLVYLSLLILLRGVYQIFYLKKRTVQTYFQEAKVIILLFFPVGLYLIFRQTFTHIGRQPFIFFLPNVINLRNYLEIFKSILSQTGGLFIISVISAIFLLKRKKIGQFLSLMTLFFGMMVFFLGFEYMGNVQSDNSLSLLGYSRWNLFLLPVISYAAFLFIVKLKPKYQIILFTCLLSLNFILWPVKANGERLPNWGSPNSDTSEYTYPYEDFYIWLATHTNIRQVFLAGQYSPYDGHKFYMNKYNLRIDYIEQPFGTVRFDAKEEQKLLSRFLNNLQLISGEDKIILYHSVNNLPLDQSLGQYTSSYKVRATFKNSSSSLYVLQKAN